MQQAEGKAGGHSKITAVIVTYNPDLSVLGRIIDRVQAQVDAVIVIDNNSQSQAQIREICRSVEGRFLPANLGLGKAQNLGIDYAIKRHSDYVLILDQDSLPDVNCIAALIDTAWQLGHNNIQFCAVGSRYRDAHNHLSEFVKVDWLRFSRNRCENQSYVEADFLISSGTLVYLDAIREIGMMDESLFIDHVDTEWFMRAKGLGFKTFGCCHAIMDHALGEKTTRIWLARWRNVPYHQAFRYYYIFRNSLLLFKRSYMPLKWKLADCVRLCQLFLFFGVFAGDRVSNLKMMGRGIVDGIKGKTGRNSSLAAT